TLNYGAQNPDLPILGPWRPISNDTQRQQYERNPYYFKVDTEGNQLPYVDRVTITYAGDPEVMNLMAISGEISVAGLDMQIINFPVIKDGEASGGYTTTLVYSERGADVALAFNQNHPDPALKSIFADVRFRQALSLAINREEINELVFLGQGTIRQATINESASFFKQEWADHFVAFDLDEANRLLDEMGLDQRNGDGIRLRSDGQPLEFQLQYLPQEGPKQEVCELVVRHWAEIGLAVTTSARERNFLLERITNGEQDATGWHVDRQLERAAYTYRASSKLSPGGDSIIRYAQGWRDWFASSGEAGVEPPPEAQEMASAFDAWQQTVMDTPEYTAAATTVHDLIAQNLYVIGVVGQAPQPVIVKNDVANVFTGSEERIWWGAANWFWHTHQPEQWFLTS
ncbi:MAG: ABC transporter substrate-binding protein, partial [Thermomicrobiales bacterium]